jgi:hypothetical protein
LSLQLAAIGQAGQLVVVGLFAQFRHPIFHGAAFADVGDQQDCSGGTGLFAQDGDDFEGHLPLAPFFSSDQQMALDAFPILEGGLNQAGVIRKGITKGIAQSGQGRRPREVEDFGRLAPGNALGFGIPGEDP